mmetsp:Transcript_22894/g.33454  ORF Transcript_22894/g.33454 Transcript_22894/m.33454 type:complete len:618 (+) Transcript_22894:43-1896(+)
MQIVVHFRKTSVLRFEDDETHGSAIRHAVSSLENIPSECFYLHCNGRLLKDNDIISGSDVIVRGSLRVSGGKGGFGAMLKSMAKRSGAKKTTDFGACRDLSGRRLRHVNDEILLKKWQEAKEQNKEFEVDEITQTGIDLWYLSAPSWADGFKASYRQRYMRPRRKTRMCLDWIRAREEGEPPANSPTWWGCPRGERCEFAHGESELRGAGKEEYEKTKQRERSEEERMKREAYIGGLDRGVDEQEMADSVACGMRAAKRLKVSEPLPSDAVSSSRALSLSSTHSAAATNVEAEAEAEVSDEALPWIRVCNGEVGVYSDGLVECAEGFGCVAVPGVKDGLRIGKWYYEVELVTGGLFQIGWADREFVLSRAEDANTEGDNGVGDDCHSFAFDGFRRRVWNEVESEYAQGTGWKAGDTVGCLLNIESTRISMSFSINGRELGEAFSSDTHSNLKAVLQSMLGSTSSGLYPAVSIEQGESMVLNAGQKAFRYLSSTTNSSREVCVVKGVLDALSSVEVPDVRLSEVLADVEKMKSTTSGSAIAPRQTSFPRIDINSSEFQTPRDFMTLGMDHLKAELAARGLKSGGTLQERAERLFFVKGLRDDQIGSHLKAPKRKGVKK